MATAIRGLTMFISDLRNATSKEQEQKRVNKEMLNIRKKFGAESLSGYDKKKYVWKLVYMYMLGYDVDIGHMEALQLLSSTKYTEKSCGYMACSILFSEGHQLLRLIIQSIKKDLTGSNEVFQCLALSCVANCGGQEFAESLTTDVYQLLLASTSRSFVKKKAALCMLRLIRKYPEVIPSEANTTAKVLGLLEDEDLGVVTSVMSLMLGLASANPGPWEDAPLSAIMLLTKLVFSKERKSVHRYYLTLNPWLQVKCLRLLQYFPPPADRNAMQRLQHVLNEILAKTAITKNVNKNNADHAVLFEAVGVIVHMALHGVSDLQSQAVTILGRFISIKEPNFRYLGLETMTKLSHVNEALPQIRKHQSTIQFLLKDPDVSIRKRALDLLYVIVDQSNAEEIVAALLKYMQTASYEMREELVLKIAILAERFATDLTWYLDVILQLISMAGDFVSADIWYRVVQIVTNNEDVQDYAATTCYKFLSSPSVHENGVKVGAYIVGEFGHTIKDVSIGGQKLFDVLMEKFRSASQTTRAIILNAVAKMANTYPDLKAQADEVFTAHLTAADLEVQQRSAEYHAINVHAKPDLMTAVFHVMPDFSERKSVLERRLKKKGKGTTDRDIWQDDEEEKKAAESDDDDSDEASDQEEGATEGVPASASSSSSYPSIAPSASASAAPSSSAANLIPLDLFDSLAVSPAPAPAAQPVATPATTSGLDFFGSGVEGAPFAQTSSASSAPASASVSASPFDTSDPFASDPFAASAPSSSSASASASSALSFPPQDLSLVTGLLRKDNNSGVLYDSPLLQIGYKAALDVSIPYQCKMVLYYGNRMEQPMDRLVVTPPAGEVFRVQQKPEEALTVAAKAQVLHYFLWHVRRPFNDTPVITLNFTVAGRPYSISLQTPLVLTTFVHPPATPFNPQSLVAAWGAMGNEVKTMRKLSAVSDVEALKAALVPAAFHMQKVDGLEQTQDNIVAAGVFHTVTKDASGQYVTMACLLRLETRPNVDLVRVTIRAGHASVSDALLAAVSRILNASPA